MRQFLSLTEYLDLSNSGIHGTIPSEIGSLSLLRRLHLANNTGLTGTVPLTISHMTHLEELTLHHTSVSGSMNIAICALRWMRLQDLYIDCDMEGAKQCLEMGCCTACV
jgi:hypothetical protein